MTDGRSPPSSLRGRLADVYVPALVSGALEALSCRLGNRATIDDPLYGRASSLAAIEPLLARVSAAFGEAGATYEHVSSTTGVDRDVAEGRLALALSTTSGAPRHLPIAIVAERRRLREIELRVYYAFAPPESAAAARKPRGSLALNGPEVTSMAELVEGVLAGLRKGAVEQVLTAFEKAGGGMGGYVSDLGAVGFEVGGMADDGRTACIEGNLTRASREPAPALLAFQRGESGLLGELRVYFE